MKSSPKLMRREEFWGVARVAAAYGSGFATTNLAFSMAQAWFVETVKAGEPVTTAALAAGLAPIVCVGETEKERDADLTLTVIGRQVKGSVPAGMEAGRLVVAYEPVWAIGTGRTATAAEVARVHAEIRRLLVGLVGEGAEKVRIRYGGSVKPGNAAELLSQANVDGARVGGASLDAEACWAIAQSC